MSRMNDFVTVVLITESSVPPKDEGKGKGLLYTLAIAPLT